MGKFGWSYHPCCSGPSDDMPAPSAPVDAVLGLLDDADVPTEINDQIVNLIEACKDDKVDDNKDEW